jgi:hypothetical protein
MIAEFKNPLKVKSSDITALTKDLAAALGKQVKLQNLEEMTRHARFSAISGSKVVYA